MVTYSLENRNKPNTALTRLIINASRAPMVFSRKIQRFPHAHPDEAERIYRDAGILTKPLEEAIKKVDAACDVCARNERPKPMKMLSLTHANKSLNEELRMDFMFHVIRGEKQILLVKTDTGAGYTQSKNLLNRSLPVTIDVLESSWFFQYGMPKKLCADEEFNHPDLQRYLEAQDSLLMARPVERHNDIGIVERKNGILKTIVNNVDADITTANFIQVVARSAFLSNMVSRSQLLSSSQLAEGY